MSSGNKNMTDTMSMPGSAWCAAQKMQCGLLYSSRRGSSSASASRSMDRTIIPAGVHRTTGILFGDDAADDVNAAADTACMVMASSIPKAI